MRRLVCAFVVIKPQNSGFLALRPNYDTGIADRHYAAAFRTALKIINLIHWFIKAFMLDLTKIMFVCFNAFCSSQNKSAISGQYTIDEVQTHFISVLHQCIRHEDSSAYFVDPISGR